MNAFLEGIQYPFRSIRFISAHLELLRFILIPFFINLIVFSTGIIWFLLKLDALLSFIPKHESWYYGALYYALAVFLTMMFLVLAFYLCIFIGNLIASPFNAALSEKTENLLGMHPPSSAGLTIIVKDVARAVGTEIKRLLYFIFWFALLALLNLIPGIGQLLYAALMIFYTSYALTFTYMDYSLDRRFHSFHQKNKIIFSDKPRMLGFGLVCLGLGLIPIVNFFLIPVFVVAGTMMTADVLSKKK